MGLNEEIIRRARTGDEAALRELYETHRSRVMRVAFSLLGDADDAEDVCQDVLTYALTRLDQYDPDRAAFTTWLHMITVSRCRDRLRRARAAFQRLTAWWQADSVRATEDPGQDLDRLDATTRVGRALMRLTPLQREALVLREVEGLSYAEIGTVLEIPMRTAQARVTAAYGALRGALKLPEPAGVLE